MSFPTILGAFFAMRFVVMPWRLKRPIFADVGVKYYHARRNVGDIAEGYHFSGSDF